MVSMNVTLLRRLLEVDEPRQLVRRIRTLSLWSSKRSKPCSTHRARHEHGPALAGC
jgi:hypothetical protein